jgi:hypothetical protein
MTRNAEIEYLTSSFGGPSLEKQYPFYIAVIACEAEGLEQVLLLENAMIMKVVQCDRRLYIFDTPIFAQSCNSGCRENCCGKSWELRIFEKD